MGQNANGVGEMESWSGIVEWGQSVIVQIALRGAIDGYQCQRTAAEDRAEIPFRCEYTLSRNISCKAHHEASIALDCQ